MTLTVVNQGEEAFLQNGVTGVAYDLRLFTNEVTAGLTSDQIDALDETDFTEATFTGYAAQSVAALDWTVTAGNPTVALNVQKSFVSSANQAAQNIWGYYLTRTSDGALIWFEQFNGPLVVEFDTDEILVTPRITLDDQGGAEVPIGSIEAFAGASVPANYLLCDGQAVSRSTFALLFAELGETWGNGDGSTTFNVPDLSGRFPLGVAAAGTGSALGETGGAIDHVHDLDTASSHARINISTSEILQAQRTGLPTWQATRTGTTSGGGSSTNSTSGTALTGDSDTANPPYAAVNYVIKAR